MIVHPVGSLRFIERFTPHHDKFAHRPYTSLSTKIEADVDENRFEITYRREKEDAQSRHHTKSYLYLELSREQFASLFEFLSSDKPTHEGADVHRDFHVGEGILQTRRWAVGMVSDEKTEKYSVDAVRFGAVQNRIVIETFEGPNPVIPYYEVEHNKDPQDRNNLQKLQNYSQEVLTAIEADTSIHVKPVPEHIKNRLKATKWGTEVIQQIEDAHDCLQNDLLHPALNCYIHAIEWTIIAYLEAVEDLDIIEQEKNGNYYYFAAGSQNLLDELTDHVDIDQKTISKIRSMNSAERRWAAHHKSGEVTREEVEAIQSRLNVLLDQLFGQNTPSFTR